MTDAPERIWATQIDAAMDGGTHCNAADRPTAPNHDAWLYIRADLPPTLEQAMQARIAELEQAIDAAERDASLSQNGAMWRWWSRQANEAAASAKAEKARAERAEAALADTVQREQEVCLRMVAAAYQDAAAQWLECRVDGGIALAALEAMSSRILARTPADASAALDRIKQEAADEALERAAVKAEDTDGYRYPAVAAAIRALKGGAK